MLYDNCCALWENTIFKIEILKRNLENNYDQIGQSDYFDMIRRDDNAIYAKLSDMTKPVSMQLFQIQWKIISAQFTSILCHRRLP